MERAGEKYRKYFQNYPVIFVSFKDIFISFKETKALSFDKCLEKAHQAIRKMYEEHAHILDGRLHGANRQVFENILNDTASEATYELSLKNLTEWLHEVHGVRPIVLIDEYDAGVHAAYAHGFYDEAIDFFASFFLAGLKDNLHLERAVMTGILRVSRESIFSELNNVSVYSLIDSEFNTCFGFTEAEVKALLEKAGMADLMDPIRRYYDGYEFGMVDIYNPWSILSFLARNDRDVVPYWVGTSSNRLIKELLQLHAFTVQEDIQTLLEGGYIEEYIDENIVFPDLRRYVRSFWNILVFTGYLKASRPGPPIPAADRPPFRLSIPNREVAEVYRTTFQAWMADALTVQGGGLRALLDALLSGNAHRVEYQLQKFASSLPSYHDVEGSEPETFYQGMMIGLLASLEVRSNRESGPGRPDVLIKPRVVGKPGVVLELKTAKRGEKSLECAMAEGLEQLEANDYAAELRASGVRKIQQLAIAFDGKRVMVLPKGAPPPEKKGAIKKAADSIRKTAKKVASSARKATNNAKR